MAFIYILLNYFLTDLMYRKNMATVATAVWLMMEDD